MIMKAFGVVATVAICVIMAGCHTPIALPQNVTTKPNPYKHSEKLLDTITFKYQTANPVKFKKLTLCIAENVTNNSVHVNSERGSVLDTPSVFHSSTGRQIGGGKVLKYVDNENGVAIANGTVKAGLDAGLLRKWLRFSMKASMQPDELDFEFSHIGEVSEGGVSAQYGFTPVGAWKEAKPMQTYSILKNVASEIKACTIGH